MLLLAFQQASAAPGFRAQENPRDIGVAELPMRRIGFTVRPRLRRGFGRRTKIPLPLPRDIGVAELPMRRIGFTVRPRLRRGFGRRTKIPLPLPVDNERTPAINAVKKSTSPSPRK
uniref:Uncharacterized protein n=1 Tax=Ascaris lumbricoides TaxID=6252 RepID=A0A0M3I5R5_ASCLU